MSSIASPTAMLQVMRTLKTIRRTPATAKNYFTISLFRYQLTASITRRNMLTS